MQRGYLDRPGCRLYYEADGSGPVLVFAHGLGGNHLSWWQQVPHFRDRYTCVTFAHRGFAPSSAPPGGPDPARLCGRSRGADRSSRRARRAHRGAIDGRLERARVCARAIRRACARWCSPRTAGTIARAPSLFADAGSVAARGSATPQRRAAANQANNIHVAGGERMAREQPAAHFLYQEIDALSGVDKVALRATADDGADAARPTRCARSNVPTLWLTGDGGHRLSAVPLRHSGEADAERARRAGRARPATRSISSGRRSSTGWWTSFSSAESPSASRCAAIPMSVKMS